MNYKLEGAGETLVFIHGLSDDLLYWEYMATYLKDDYQVLRIDLRGHGESELGNDKITIGTYADDLYNLLEDLNIANVNLIGFSLGGAVALDFAVRYPQMVSSLVLMSTFCKEDNHLEPFFVKFKDALESSFEEFFDLILPMVLCPDVIEGNEAEIEMLKKFASQNANPQAYIKAIDACADFNVEDKLSQISIPTLILVGKYDELTLPDTQMELKNKIKDSKVIVFDNVRHNLLVGKNNSEILNILKKFYKKIKSK
ncbi:alpha/beta fold hydrolase [Methanobrevibacter sp. YE315]|uniref:alpha/beta fold hydrolase n=1 Tax=Methanobrevibacter sp. YE315 TaxID=1609968 RepID=UPI000831AFC6|nr:alpha/beta hydrolase [Methanobrevibacter sp. YE315]